MNWANSDEEPPECAICTDVYWEPVRLPACGHVFCRGCVAEVVRHGSAHTDSVRCPLCRLNMLADADATVPTQWIAELPIESELERTLRSEFPQAWERRRAEVELRAACSITVLIGNRVVLPARAGEDARWSIFVEVVAPHGWSERPTRGGGGGGGGGVGGGGEGGCGGGGGIGGGGGASGARSSHAAAGNAAVTGMLIQCVRITLPEEQTPEGEGGDGFVEIEDAPYELRGLADRVSGEFTAGVVVFWQRRLKLEPLTLEHRVRLCEGGVVGRHEVPLPNGLTLARVVERTKPKARVGVGSAHESLVY